MEVLAGARKTQQEATLRHLLMRFELLRIDAVTDFDGPVTIRRQGRRVGVTPRGMIDCVIASVARRHGAALLAHAIDLDRVARIVGIEHDDASLRAASSRPCRPRAQCPCATPAPSAEARHQPSGSSFPLERGQNAGRTDGRARLTAQIGRGRGVLHIAHLDAVTRHVDRPSCRELRVRRPAPNAPEQGDLLTPQTKSPT